MSDHSSDATTDDHHIVIRTDGELTDEIAIEEDIWEQLQVAAAERNQSVGTTLSKILQQTSD